MYGRSFINQLQKMALGLSLVIAPAVSVSAQTQFSNSEQQPSILYENSPNLIAPLSGKQVQPISKEATKNQFALNVHGQLTGRITTGKTSPAGLSVFVVKETKVIAISNTDRTGFFTVGGLQPGSYSLIVGGNKSFAAKGISIVGPGTGVTNSLEITTASTQYPGIQNLISKTLSKDIVEATQKQTFQVSAITSEPEIINKVRVINGKVRGVVTSLTSQTNAAGVQVHLIQNGEAIAQVETNSTGNFILPDVAPGTYDFVAVGSRGMSAMKIEAVGVRGSQELVEYEDDVREVIEIPLAEDVYMQPVQANNGIEYIAGNEFYMEPGVSSTYAPMQYATESIASGGAGGGVAGNFGNFTNFGRGGMVGGRLGGRFGSRFTGGLGGGRFSRASGFGRLLTLGALGGSIIAISDSNPSAASPTN